MAKYREMKGTEAASGTSQRGSLADSAQRLTYAWLGLFSAMSDEARAFYAKCVTRGAQKAQEARTSTRGRQAGRRPGRKTAQAGQPIARMLDRSRLATKSEMDALIARVDTLSREVDVLIEQQRSR
jgi:polyhydroxyalkanoate synthesis regulator phasin